MTVQDIRVSALLTGKDALHLRELMRLECASASDLVRDALREYRAARAKPRANARELLVASGFVGGDEGPDDLSTCHKEIFAGTLEEKLLLRVRKK